MGAVYALCGPVFLMLLCMVFVGTSVRMSAFLKLCTRSRGAFFITHSMASGGISAEGQSQDYNGKQEFHVFQVIIQSIS